MGEFYDPDNPEHLIAADHDLAAVAVDVRFRHAGVSGHRRGRPDDGCCSHGAFLSDKDDRKRLDAAVKKLTDEDWQVPGKGLGPQGLSRDGRV